MREALVVSVWIAGGAALGGLLRFWCSGMLARLIGESFPFGTLFVNVTGSYLIGLVAELAGPDGRLLIAPEHRQFLMVGVFGGFTTFSSFSLQTLYLVRDGQFLWAAGNVLGSVILCLVAVWLGAATGIAINR